MVTKEQNKKVVKARTSSKYIRINKSSWEKENPRVNRDFYIRDTKLEGYYIRVRPSGKKTYAIQSRIGGVGRKISLTVGDCNLMTEAEAREKARRYLMKCKEGIHPGKEVKRKALKNKNILDLVDDYIEEEQFNLATNTKADYVGRISRRMKPLLKVQVGELTSHEIKSWWKGCPKVRSDEVAFVYARKVFDVAVGNEYLDSNPFDLAKKTIKFKAIPERETLVAQHQLSDFLSNFIDASEKMKTTVRDYLVFVLVTGKRKGEAESLTWDNVDFKNSTITLPITKNKKVDVVPMTDFLYLLLRSRKNSPEAHKHWVFPSHYNNGKNHITSPYKALAKVRDFDLSPHDFRRTFATATKELGIADADISSLLNHSKQGVTEGYIFRSLEYKEKNLEAVYDYFNKYGDDALSYMAVHWYKGASDLFVPSPEDTKIELDREKSREHLLAENEDKFKGYGHPEYKAPDE